jgi:hypothetical protein
MSALQSRIDDAFYRALSNASSRPVPANDAPGGFVLGNDDELPGGFLPPSPPAIALESRLGSGDDQSSYIPLSRIPYALQLLDLPPDDEEALSVFRNAATGWGDDQPSSRRAVRERSSTTTSDDNDVAEERVSLRDWRAVCNALMDAGDDEDYMGDNGIDDDEDPGVAGEYPSSELEESSGGSSDEYRITNTRSRKGSRKSASAAVPDSTRKTRAKKTQSGAARRRSSPSQTTGADITLRQRRECLRTFLLFFPGVPEEVAKHRRLGVREVNAAATVLNEKIKTEEVRPLTPGCGTIGRMTVCSR